MQIKVDLKIFLFFLIFLITRRIKIYEILMLFALLHEIGHLICGILLGFKPQKITILPYGLKINFTLNGFYNFDSIIKIESLLNSNYLEEFLWKKFYLKQVY